MDYFHFAIASDWEYDRDFIDIVEEKARHLNLSTYVIWPYNLEETIRLIEEKKLSFGFLFDRASDTSPEFQALQKRLRKQNVKLLDSWEQLRWTSDKATMHLEFLNRGLHTPYTIILPPFDSHEKILLSLEDLSHLGRPFIIKPANTTGGGIGVVDGAETLQDVLNARQEFQQDKYLLQEKVIPLEKDDRRFWFRGFYSCGVAQCAWWNDLTHLYTRLSLEEIGKYHLQALFEIVRTIAEISRLNFFSTEIALNQSGQFVIVDYVNEVCDMRLQSRHFDGVPDSIVHTIAESIVGYVRNRLADQ
ncbi:MAG: hypothetical protein Kow0042_06160 [Calditrichia bacterium]